MNHLYHYTDALSAADILREKAIVASSQRLHRDVLCRDDGYETEPLVWLTTNPYVDGTIVSKMLAASWPMTLVGDLYRFVVEDAEGRYLSLGEYVDRTGMDPAWWNWVVKTGELAGSDYTTWRLSLKDIPASKWLAAEVLDSIDSKRTLWKLWEEA